MQSENFRVTFDGSPDLSCHDLLTVHLSDSDLVKQLLSRDHFRNCIFRIRLSARISLFSAWIDMS